VKYYTNKARQAGMTLIELTVVLLVLIGLAGLLIPYVSGFVGKTHDSTGASNIQALNNAMARFAVENYDDYPDKMDSLIQTDNALFSKMMSSAYLEAHTLTTSQAKGLTSVGINNLMVMDETTNNATFDNTGAATGVASGRVVARLKGDVLTNLSDIMGKPTDSANYDYLVFGVGDDSTIAGKTVADVPVHFAGRADMAADAAYNHFVAVFEVPQNDFCDISGWGTTLDLGLNATDDAAPTATSLVAPATAPVTQALCVAENAVTEAVDTDNIHSAGGVVWVVAIETDAKFIGSAMAMMMQNFEGLGGALNNYYKKVNN